MTTFQCCEPAPIPWALNFQNPYDVNNWMYGHRTHKYIEDVGQRGVQFGPPYGDRYMGTVMKECERGPSTPETNKKVSGSKVGYTDFLKDDGTASTCLQSSETCTPPGGTDYGPCIWGKDHYWWARHWDELTDTDIKECCVTPPGDPAAGDTIKDGSVVATERRTKQCPPIYWAGSPLCLPIMLKHCTSDNWPSTKVTSCDKYMNDFSGAQQSSKEQIFSNAMDSWLKNTLDGGNIKPDPDSDPFVKNAIKYCTKYPGLCDIYLSSACKNVTRDDILASPDLSSLCGCFMADSQYLLPGIIPVECNGACAINAHPDVNGVTRGQLNSDTGMRDSITCNQTTCVIDDVAINMIKSKVKGTINFDQLCGNCPDGSCTCIMNDINIDSVNSVIGGDIDLTQSCKGCSVSEYGTTTPIGCDGGSPPSPAPPANTEPLWQEIIDEIESIFDKNKPFWIAGIAVIILIIVGLFCFGYIHLRQERK